MLTDSSNLNNKQLQLAGGSYSYSSVTGATAEVGPVVDVSHIADHVTAYFRETHYIHLLHLISEAVSDPLKRLNMFQLPTYRGFWRFSQGLAPLMGTDFLHHHGYSGSKKGSLHSENIT